ncbi:MAG: zinc ribbon domain-containing protein, partial [Candidatus Saccharicenans sp.]|nr:zinc ribbon domain-containing protein [Candidatus Saccharicenans sp.]
KFYSVQALLKKNCVSKHNEAKPVKHSYIQNGGLLWCGKCGKEMEGRSGTGARGVRYYYYICKNMECKFKLPADEIEGVVLRGSKSSPPKRTSWRASSNPPMRNCRRNS